MGAIGVISADRRYVRISTAPTFSTIGDVQTFTFAGSPQQTDTGTGTGPVPVLGRQLAPFTGTVVGSEPLGGGYACAPSSQTRMPFCTCIRLAACATTTLCGPSITSSVTSSPRRAGKQCMNTRV